MADYRAALARDRSQILPLRGTEQQVSAARARYQMLVHRVSSSPAREAALAWEAAALSWFQGDDSGTASAEADAWETAMRITGEAVRATDWARSDDLQALRDAVVPGRLEEVLPEVPPDVLRAERSSTPVGQHAGDELVGEGRGPGDHAPEVHHDGGTAHAMSETVDQRAGALASATELRDLDRWEDSRHGHRPPHRLRRTWASVPG